MDRSKRKRRRQRSASHEPIGTSPLYEPKPLPSHRSGFLVLVGRGLKRVWPIAVVVSVIFTLILGGPGVWAMVRQRVLHRAQVQVPSVVGHSVSHGRGMAKDARLKFEVECQSTHSNDRNPIIDQRPAPGAWVDYGTTLEVWADETRLVVGTTQRSANDAVDLTVQAIGITTSRVSFWNPDADTKQLVLEVTLLNRTPNAVEYPPLVERNRFLGSPGRPGYWYAYYDYADEDFAFESSPILRSGGGIYDERNRPVVIPPHGLVTTSWTIPAPKKQTASLRIRCDLGAPDGSGLFGEWISIDLRGLDQLEGATKVVPQLSGDGKPSP